MGVAPVCGPARGGCGVEVPDRLGVGDRLAGALDPDVLAPGRRGLGASEQETREPVVVNHDRAGGAVLHEGRDLRRRVVDVGSGKLADLGPGHGVEP